MSFNSSTSGETVNESESIDPSELQKRIEDLEVEIYGHDRTTGLSAGESAVATVKRVVVFLEALEGRTGDDPGAAIDEVHGVTAVVGLDETTSKQALEKLRRQGEVYEPDSGRVRAT